MNARAKVTEILNECGAVLKRARKHEVWELPNGKNFVRASTPSDTRADANNLSQLKRELEIVKPTTVGTRKPKAVSKGRAEAKPKYDKLASLSMAESLRMAGLSDDALRDRVGGAETRMCAIERRLAEIEHHIATCWACRIQRWIKTKWLKAS